MSGASIPYHLRPNKAVDRRIFLDLLMRFERWKSLEGAAYISMGAYPLEDHRMVHRLLGITRLIPFDLDAQVVARQRFNRPVNTCHCLHLSSDQLIADLDEVLATSGCADATSLVIWLDYTDPKKMGQQIREFQSLLQQVTVGDFIRVTVNANPNEWEIPAEVEDKPELATKIMEKQLQKLKLWIGDFLPSGLRAGDMTPVGLAKAISHSFGVAALQALPTTGPRAFCPLSIVRYADTTQMLSMSGVVAQKGTEPAIRQALGLKSWQFSSNSWAEIHELIVPALTLRERLFLERGIVDSSADELIHRLGFEQAAGVEMKEFLENYKNYYRFYPTLLPVEM